jgi:hypothetical protein
MHCDVHGKLNMLFKNHSSSLHCYNPSREEFNCVNTASENMGTFTESKIESVDKARELYTSLAYPSNNDYKWILKSN